MPDKILFLLHLPPPVHGSSVVGLSIRKSKVINNKINCNYINLLASNNVSESGGVNLKKILSFVFTWIKVLFSIIRVRPHICYIALTTTGIAFYRDLLLIVLLKIFRITSIYHLHNKGVRLFQHKLIYRHCYKFVFKKAEVILLSKRLYSDIQSFVPESNVHICPNGVTDEAIYFRMKSHFTELSKSNNIVKILFLANLIESKGVYVLLEACSILKKKNISFECVLVGGEGDITALQFENQINNLELDDVACYLGKRYGEEKNKTFEEADIFVFPTHEDCFPLVLLEAMSHSLPVISTFEGGIQDIVNDNETGFLIEGQDPKALAEKLEILIKNPILRQQMGAAGRKKYEMEFTIEIFENRIIEILENVIK